MLSQRSSTRLTYVMRACAVLMGVAVSSGTSCLKPSTSPKARVGTISGSVLSSQGPGIASATVTATSDSNQVFTATTDANGAFDITGVADGSGSVSVSGLPSGCTTPTPVNYDMTGAANLTATFGITCTTTP